MLPLFTLVTTADKHFSFFYLTIKDNRSRCQLLCQQETKSSGGHARVERKAHAGAGTKCNTSSRQDVCLDNRCQVGIWTYRSNSNTWRAGSCNTISRSRMLKELLVWKPCSVVWCRFFEMIGDQQDLFCPCKLPNPDVSPFSLPRRWIVHSTWMKQHRFAQTTNAQSFVERSQENHQTVCMHVHNILGRDVQRSKCIDRNSDVLSYESNLSKKLEAVYHDYFKLCSFPNENMLKTDTSKSIRPWFFLSTLCTDIGQLVS